MWFCCFWLLSHSNVSSFYCCLSKFITCWKIRVFWCRFLAQESLFLNIGLPYSYIIIQISAINIWAWYWYIYSVIHPSYIHILHKSGFKYWVGCQEWLFLDLSQISGLRVLNVAFLYVDYGYFKYKILHYEYIYIFSRIRNPW